ncbi:MAG TPA: DUF5818 domain-containing protein [Candidatus Angelobacter sp.]
MRKLSLVTGILLLASAWMLAQNSTPPTSQYPSSAPSSAQSAAQDAQQAATQAGKDAAHAATGNIEGCIAGSAGSYTLTDSSGKTYQLAGDTAGLSDHVGHDVKVSGTMADAASAAGGTPTITVKKVKMVSATCPNK